MVYPTANETWEIVSTDANDTALGTGARSVLVRYLDEDYIEQALIATLDGTTPVAMNSNHFRPNGAIVASSGTGRKNAGDIIIRASGGGNPRQFLRAGFSRSADSNFTVPANKTLFTIRINPRYGKNESGTVRAVVAIFGTNTDTVTGDFPFYQDSTEIKVDAPSMLPGKTDLRLEAKSDNVGPISVISGFEYVLVED